MTEPTAWINNMATFTKPEKIRLCIDPKPLHQALLRSVYHMPTLEDMLFKQPQAGIFDLDACNVSGCPRCLPTVQARQSCLLTFWTPWDRIRWLKPLCRVSVAPEIYQHKQHKLLSHLASIHLITDDILVVCLATQMQTLHWTVTTCLYMWSAAWLWSSNWVSASCSSSSKLYFFRLTYCSWKAWKSTQMWHESCPVLHWVCKIPYKIPVKPLQDLWANSQAPG